MHTLFAEFCEEAEARDGWPSEDDGVFSGNVLAELLSHKAVELRFVLQGGQTICTLAIFQMDRDLQKRGGIKSGRVDANIFTFLAYRGCCLNPRETVMFNLQNCSRDFELKCILREKILWN